MPQAKSGDKVKVHYTGKLTDGTLFDTSEGKAPLEFVIGENKLLKPFENACIGLEPEQSVEINIAAEDGYGPRHEQLVSKIPIAELPAELNPEPGMKLQVKAPDGRHFIIKVIEKTEEEIVVDANHDLAGQDLVFNITLVEIV